MGFYSFCRGSRALPMLSPLHIGGPCGERELFQTHYPGSVVSGVQQAKLIGSRDQEQWLGSGPIRGFPRGKNMVTARTQTVNSTDAKTFYPHGLRPWDGEWEEPAWDHARFARVIPCREKVAGLRPAPRWGAPFVFTWSQ